MSTRHSSFPLKKSHFFCIAVAMFTFSIASPAEEIMIDLIVDHPQEVLPWIPIEIKSTAIYRGGKKIFIQGGPQGLGGASTIKIFDPDEKLLYNGSFSAGLGACDETGDMKNIETAYRPVEITKGMKTVQLQTMNYRTVDPAQGFDSREPIFGIPGEYHISFQGNIAYYPPGGTFIPLKLADYSSESSRITVIEPGEYSEALQAVKQLTYARFFLEPRDLIFFVEKGEIKDINAWDRELTQFLSKHGDSPWAPFAWHARAIIARNRGRTRRQIEYAGHAADTALKFGIYSTRWQALELQAQGHERLWFQGDKAEKIRELIVTETHARMGTEPKVPPPDPREYYEHVLKRLTEDGYDHEGLFELAPEAYDELSVFRRNLNDEFKEKNKNARFGENYYTEFYRRLADATDRIVRVNMKPVSQEELRKRIQARREQQDMEDKIEEQAYAFRRRFVERLESEGYDPTGLWDLAPEAYKKLVEFVQKNNLRERAGEIDYLEATKLRAELLEKLVREHTKPVSQEELREQKRRRLEKEYRNLGQEPPPE